MEITTDTPSGTRILVISGRFTGQTGSFRCPTTAVEPAAPSDYLRVDLDSGDDWDFISSELRAI